jgi:hypothetical protein
MEFWNFSYERPGKLSHINRRWKKDRQTDRLTETECGLVERDRAPALTHIQTTTKNAPMLAVKAVHFIYAKSMRFCNLFGLLQRQFLRVAQK